MGKARAGQTGAAAPGSQHPRQPIIIIPTCNQLRQPAPAHAPSTSISSHLAKTPEEDRGAAMAPRSAAPPVQAVVAQRASQPTVEDGSIVHGSVRLDRLLVCRRQYCRVCVGVWGGGGIEGGRYGRLHPKHVCQLGPQWEQLISKNPSSLEGRRWESWWHRYWPPRRWWAGSCRARR